MEKRATTGIIDGDKRMIMRSMINGEISEEKLKKYLLDLPDVSSNAEEIVIE
jgi:hypothetical protein